MKRKSTGNQPRASCSICKVGLVSILDVKTKSRLDEISSDVKTSNTIQSIGQPKWNESFELTLGNETGLCVEVWNESTVLEKSKRKQRNASEKFCWAV